MKEQINYTAQDIERYHSGALSPAQMHALEKAALDDPFLADALEGYAFAKTASADVAFLQEKLKQRIDKNEKRGVLFIGSNWMKIAALFIVIAGGGWLIIQSLFPSSKNEVATTISTNKQPAPATPIINADSVATLSDSPAINETVALSKNKPGFPVQPSYKTDNKKQANESSPQASTLSLMAKRDTNVALTATSMGETDQVKDRADSLLNVTAMRKEAAAPVSRSRTNDTIRNVDVVLQKSERALEEVVLNPKAKSNAAQPRKMMMKVDTLEPAKGWGYFDDYIASNIKPPDKLKIKPVSGEVELSFNINKEGEPVNITVTKSLCDKCDEEAIRLLKEGPKWKNKAKNGKVKIRFTSP